MGARHELNKFHILGSLGLAAVVGVATGSWSVFVFVAAVLIGTAIYGGQIRGKNGKR